MKNLIKVGFLILAVTLGSCRNTASEELVYVDRVDTTAVDEVDTIPSATLGEDDAAGVTTEEMEGAVMN